MSLAWLLLAGLASSPQDRRQQDGWVTFPPNATVGDTVWLERRFALPTGWRLRAGRLQGNDDVEPLADPLVQRLGGGWVVRYPVTAWRPGVHTMGLPSLWRLGPDAQADSVPGGSATFTLASVIPDSVTRPAPRPALAPLRLGRHDPRPALLATLLAAASLAGAWWWRRRPARAFATRVPPVPLASVADQRWIDAGEPKAVAARAAGQLRAALAHAVPEAHLGLSTAECLATVERKRPQAPVRDLAEVLGALDGVAFAATNGADIANLARRARALAERLGP